MDDRAFDDLSRSLAKGVSRRTVLAGLTGAALSGLGLRRVSAQSGGATGSPCNVFGNPDAQCPAGCECVENVEDDCDPEQGGADCPGACQPVAATTPCGPNVCSEGEFCCNESCGICAPVGGVCTQEFCGEQCAAEGEGCLAAPAGCCQGLVCNSDDSSVGLCLASTVIPTAAPEQPAPAPMASPAVVADSPTPGTSPAPSSSRTDDSDVSIRRLPDTGTGVVSVPPASTWRTPLALLAGATAIVAGRLGWGSRAGDSAIIDPPGND